MDLQELKDNRDRIITEYAEKQNHDTVRHIRYEIDWILSRYGNNNWETLEDAWAERVSSKKYSNRTRMNKKEYFRCIQKKLCPDSVPKKKIHCRYDTDPKERITASKTYLELNEDYQALLNKYILIAKEAGKKCDTVIVHCALAACFLRYLQEKEVKTLLEATDAAVMSFFYSDGTYEHQIRSYSFKEKLVVVFKNCASSEEYANGCQHVLNLIPNFRYVRKNVEYLTTSEIEAIRSCIDSEHFSPEECAILMLLLYTGMRSCDIAFLKISDIDWNRETLRIVQQKTAEPLEIPMLPSVGNAIFDYLKGEGTVKKHGYLFSGDDEERHISAKSVRYVAYKAYKTAGIRQGKGNRKGTHLFRHNTATKLLENGVQHPVISRTLGHASPDSLGTYLHADFKHLSESAISLEEYPLPWEVWNP